MEFQSIFSAATGGPSEFYRIPAMITTKNGVVVTCADARYDGPHDNPNRIDKYVRRSLDSGKTWGPYIPVMREVGTERMKASAAIDPVLTYSSETGRIFMHCVHSPAGVGIGRCGLGIGEDENGNRIINGGGKKYILKEGKLYLDGTPTSYQVCENGDVLDGVEKVGNIYIGDDFMEEETFWFVMSYSDDDGLTWSKPQSLNTQVKEAFMSSIGPGPGNGIVLKHGKHKGRVVVPAYFGVTETPPLKLSGCMIYSDDNGVTWKRGKTILKDKDYMTIDSSESITETQLIEKEDGTLKLFMRSEHPCRCVAVAYSRDGGESWEDFSYDENLPQPVCQLSVLKLENMDKPYVVFLNPADKEGRRNGTVRLSEDDGETFPYSRMLSKDFCMYSSLAQLPDGNIGAFLEADPECRQIVFTKFSLDWMKGKEK